MVDNHGAVRALHFQRQLERALRDGWTWSLVAEALGVTRQAVHKKHAKRLRAVGVEPRRR